MANPDPKDTSSSDNGLETGNWLLDAILRPGSSTSAATLAFLDKVFYFLFVCIFFLMWLKDFQDIHTYVFMALAVGLFFSVKFFVNELRSVQAAEKQNSTKPPAESDASRQAEQEEFIRADEQRAKEQQELLKTKVSEDGGKKSK